MSPRAPRLIIIRHGQTTWSASGQHTSTTDLPLTEAGREMITSSLGRLPIDKNHLTHIYCSPRLRAKQTLELLAPLLPDNIKPTYDDRIQEWRYGDYEGLKTAEILELRKKRGVKEAEGRSWDVFRDGCEGGESPEEVEKRVDSFVEEVVRLHWNEDGSRREENGDVLCVAHGHLCRVLLKRWLGLKIGEPVIMTLETGSAGVLSYAHHNMKERALAVGA